MTLIHALRYASIFAVAALLATSLGTHSLRAQGTGATATDADSAAKKKADAAKATAAKQAGERSKQPAQAGSPQGYRPDPVTNY